MNKLQPTSLKKSIYRGLVCLVCIAALAGNPVNAASQPDLPPMAVNDFGVGYTTARHRAFITGNVLGNDLSPQGGPLSVQSFDTAKTKGRVSLVNPWQDGSLDPSFGSGGKVTVDLRGYYEAHALVILPDDRILTAGYFTPPSGPINSQVALARFQPDGELDISFNHSGVLITPSNGDAAAAALALQPDNNFLLAGSENTAPRPTDQPACILYRYKPDGGLDETFGNQGKVMTDYGGSGSVCRSIALQPDGKIILAGWASFGPQYYQSTDFALARFNPDGSLDTTFGAGGKVVSSFGNSSMILSAALQTDGKIVAVGLTGPRPAIDFALARYNSDGSLDKSFHTTGLFTTRFNGYSSAQDIKIQPDGKLVVAGFEQPNPPSIYYRFALARFNENSSPDTTFNGNGLVTTDLPYSAVGQDLVLQPDGKIILAGDAWDGVNYEFAAARYNPDGSLDTGFNGDGKLTTPFGSMHYRVLAGLQHDGKLVLAGSYANGYLLVRYTAGGSFLYDPAGAFDNLPPGKTAIDSFTYTATDGVLTSTATVTVTILGPMEYFLPVAN